MKVKVIIPASGSGERFGSKIPKQFLKIEGKEIIALTLEKFNSIKLIDEIIISTKPEYFVKISAILRKYNLRKVSKIVEGGKRRQDSVYNALITSESEDDDMILVHDAVRPFISKKKIKELIITAKKYKCVIPGLPVAETVKIVDGKNYVTETIDRNNVRTIQTPQVFRFDILRKSFEKAYSEKFTGTDEAAIAENAGYKIKVIDGEKANVKITYREDVFLITNYELRVTNIERLYFFETLCLFV